MEGMVCGSEGRDWSKSLTSQGTPGIVGSHSSEKKGMKHTHPLSLQERINPADILCGNSGPQNYDIICCCCFKTFGMWQFVMEAPGS